MPTVEENALIIADRTLEPYKTDLSAELYEALKSDIYIAVARAYAAGAKGAELFGAAFSPARIAPISLTANRAQRRAAERKSRR